ncbi:MAG: response regulator [Treponema sp.]|jgi:putative two-component system response regulator|nr:response regulator [Treponema sp.]
MSASCNGTSREDMKTIFLVDDDITNLAFGNDALCKHYNVITMNSGSRLIKMLENHTADLILLDVEMPEMDGYSTIKILKSNEHSKYIPVIFLTAKSDTESELTGLSLGAIDYIAKPFSPPLLLKRIQMHLLVESQKNQLIDFNDNLMEMVDVRTKMIEQLKNALLKTMAELVEYRDSTTGEHIERTRLYMSLLLETLQKNEKYQKEIESWDMDLILQSSQLHDVGKIAIRDGILLKPDKLTSEEYEEIKKHVTFGENVIERIKKNTSERAFLDQAKILITTHHEKWNGSGYPNGLKGEEIPLQGRLMAIADVYDALISERPYKKAFTHEEAVNIIIGDSGEHFDPDLVDLFLGIADRFKDIANETPQKNDEQEDTAAANTENADEPGFSK